MGHAYRAVGWNPEKRRYDAVLGGGVLLYVGLFAATTFFREPHATLETVAIRACGTAAYFLLHVILSIGPLARLDRRFLPLLYNRRHLGVTMFSLALVHGAAALLQFHTGGTQNPFVSLLTAEARFDSLSELPFQPLGAAALAILFLMAATSHDFWLANLGAPAWKALHMLVYVAYGLLVMHVALGALQSERSPWLVVLTGAGLAVVLALHVAAARRERPLDRARDGEARDGYVDVCAVDEIPEGRARIACLAGERVAIFRFDGRLAALSNACQHQNGPLGEGRVIDGCVTCPWHGYQYDPETGASPAPFTEAVPTFDLLVEAGRVRVATRPNPPGVRSRGAFIGKEAP